MFCNYCGAEINDNSVFCNVCGKKVLNQNKNQSKTYDGSIKKCPNCGEIVDAFTVRCKTCGYEFRESSSVSSIEDLKKNIEIINNSTVKDNIFITSLGMVGERTNKIVSAIKSFNIPNTKEDIVELMFFASSNISIDSYSSFQSAGKQNEKAISEAWKSKMEQAYQKAKISLINDSAFSQIENIYISKITEIETAERNRMIKFIVFYIFLFTIILLPFILLMIYYK